MKEGENKAENVIEVVVPKETVIYEGVAEPQFIKDSLGNITGSLPGGEIQIYILEVYPTWFK